MKFLLFTCALVAAVMAETELEKALKTGNDQFTANMFQEVAKKEKGKSCVLSAFSVLSPLAQLALASVGASHDEILKTIGFPNDNVTKEVFTDVNKRLRNVNGVELKQANKVYVGKEFTLNDDFAAVSKSVFDSEVQNINFSKNKEAADEINAWVEDHTNKRIKNLVDPDAITSDTAAILVNAIYFKGKWKNPFNKDYTQERDFHVTKENTIKVQMMSRKDDFKYGESEALDAKFLELPYEGEETSLVVALPNKVDGIDDLIKKISEPAALNNALTNMYYQEVDVALPKFKIETTTDLKEVLQKMKIEKLFSPRDAKLNNLLKDQGDLYVSNALQKAFIEVNEEGAEAAAANQFTVKTRSGKLSPYFKFEADRPFYFELKNRNLILFNGIYYS